MLKSKPLRSLGVLFPLLFVSGMYGCATAPRENPWPKVPTPAPGPARSIGAYAAGCVQGAAKLPMDGAGYQAVRIARNRHFGHPTLVEFLESVGREGKKAKERAFLVGDLGLPRGGPTLSGHSSHQTGLDADIWYWRPEKKLSEDERERLSSKSLVNRATKAVDTSAFGKDAFRLLRRFAEAEAVERIFVNYAIKKHLCTHHAAEPWVRKTRAWYGHDHHFHIRLRCPPDSPECQAGDPIPEGNGCDETLAWWYSEEARVQESTKQTKPPEMPRLPEACEAVLELP
jgi:penicillin-insensitive murein endopeptidase